MAAPVPGTQAWYQSRATPIPKTNVPAAKPVNVSAAPSFNPIDYASQRGGLGGVDMGGTPAGVGASFGTADIAKTFAPAMTKAATPGRWDITAISPEMISSDWEPVQAQAAGAQQISDAEASFQKALRQAFIDYGGDITKVGDWSRYIDAPTMEAARTNKFSAAAESLQAYTKALAKSRSALAAKGMLSSGRTGLQTKAVMDAREKAEYEALRTFSGGADTGMQTIGQMRQQVADKIAAANAAAAARLAAAHPPTWIEPTAAEYSQLEYAPAAAAPPAYVPGPELDREQAYYQSRATPIPKPPPKKKPSMSFGTMVGGRY